METLAGVQVAAGDFASVIKSYRRVVELQPDNFMAFYNMAIAFSRLDLIDDAMSSLLDAIKINPAYIPAVVMLSEYYKGLGSYPEAIEVLRSGVTHSPENVRVNWLLGACLQETGQLEDAAAHFGKACRLMRSCHRTPEDYYPTHDPDLGDTFKYASGYKLKHDIEQFEYLMHKGLLGLEFEETVAAYQEVHRAFCDTNASVDVSPLLQEHAAKIGATYNRLVYESSRGRDRHNPLNPELDWDDVVADYLRNQPGITHFLTGCYKRMRCKNSTNTASSLLSGSITVIKVTWVRMPMMDLTTPCCSELRKVCEKKCPSC